MRLAQWQTSVVSVHCRFVFSHDARVEEGRWPVPAAARQRHAQQSPFGRACVPAAIWLVCKDFIATLSTAPHSLLCAHGLADRLRSLYHRAMQLEVAFFSAQPGIPASSEWQWGCCANLSAAGLRSGYRRAALRCAAFARGCSPAVAIALSPPLPQYS